MALVASCCKAFTVSLLLMWSRLPFQKEDRSQYTTVNQDRCSLWSVLFQCCSVWPVLIIFYGSHLPPYESGQVKWYNIGLGQKKLHNIKLSHTLHCIALHCIALHCIALHCIALHCIALHCIALHCIALHCIALHCIAGTNDPNWIRPGKFVNQIRWKGILWLWDDTWEQTVLPLYCEGALVPMSLLWLSVAGRLVLSVEQSEWKYTNMSATTTMCLGLQIQVIYSCNSNCNTYSTCMLL